MEINTFVNMELKMTTEEFKESILAFDLAYAEFAKQNRLAEIQPLIAIKNMLVMTADEIK